MNLGQKKRRDGRKKKVEKVGTKAGRAALFIDERGRQSFAVLVLSSSEILPLFMSAAWRAVSGET